MNLSEISINRPVFAWMLMAALMIFGALSFSRLGVSQLPDVDFPVVSISLSLNGAAPEVVESQVIDPIEDALMQIQGIRTVTSSAQQSSGSIAVEFDLDRDIDTAVQEVQDRISQVQNLLPTDLFPPSVRKSNPEDQPILWIVLTSDPNVPVIDTMIFARNYLYDQFGTVPGVGDIALGGYVDPALRVWTHLDSLKKYNLTSDDVLQAIQREHVDIPAGRIENNEHEFNIRIMGEAQNPVDFGKILISNRSVLGPNYKALQLNKIAEIEEGTIDIRRISRFNGQHAVGLGILKQHGSNAVDVARLVRKKLATISPTIPSKFKIAVRSDNTRFIQQSVNQLKFMLLLSAILTSFVCFLFLGSWGSTINVLMAIPTSIVGSFIAIYFFGFTLNTFTFLGLSLAIGIVVDDSIMMLENIVRHQEMGETRRTAALRGSREITFAAMAATIAVVAIFVPVIFMRGVIGRYFFQYGITVTTAVLLSLLEALTLTPMRCSRYLTIQNTAGGFSAKIDSLFKRLARRYQNSLHILLAHRWKTIFVTLFFFFASLLIARRIPSEMIPAQDQSQILFRLKAPVGSALDFTDGKFKIAEDYLVHSPGVEGVFSAIGGFGGDAVNQGIIFVNLVDRSKRKFSQAELMKRFRKDLQAKLKGVQVIAQDLSLRGFAVTRGFPIEFIVQGPDWDKLTDYSHKMMDALTTTGFATDINTDIQANMPEVKILPNRPKLALHGVPLSVVTSAIDALVGGAILKAQTEYPKAGHRYEIELRLVAAERNKVTQLSEIRMRNNRGEIIPLSELVDIKQSPSLQLISRLNRERAITVYANAASGHSQQEVLDTVEKLGRSILPGGYSLQLTGSSKTFRESFQSLVFALLLGLLVSYMVLASQFNSFIQPLAVLIALPFSFTGAFIGLALFHQSINIYSLIGFILLMGIVKKNSILLVDFTNHWRAQGADVQTALLEACPVRLRPILMTSLATIAGALPEALALGPGSETTIPMAIAIIGGIAASTTLTLFVVPCAYSLLARLEIGE